MKSKIYLEQIIDALALLSRKVEINSSLNLLDLNIHAENFYRDFLNLSLSLNLCNINAINQNAAAIDLGDITAKIAFQVTSTSALKKTRSTVEGFIKKDLHHHYDRLIILNIVKASEHKDPLIGELGVYQLDTKKDIWDCKTLAKKLLDKDVTTLEKVAQYTRKELGLTEHEKPPKEVSTLLALIELLSNDDHPAAGKGFIEEPDPDGKINTRFSSHATYLKESYIKLYTTYGGVCEAITKGSDIGTVRIQKIGNYLRSYSDSTLTACDSDPHAAIMKMTKFFIDQLSKINIEYDEEAIKFYLIDQVIRCNVFPRAEQNL